MVLADDVINKIGQIVLPSGAILNERHKKSLQRFNISVIKIISEDVQIDREQIQEEKKLLLSFMDWAPRNKNETDLLEAACMFLAQKNETNRTHN